MALPVSDLGPYRQRERQGGQLPGSIDRRVQALVERCRSIEWHRPLHNPARAMAAYQRWLAILGLRRRVAWAADPADVAAWQAETPGMLTAWSALAALNAAGSSVPGLLLDASPGERAMRRRTPPGGALVAANWAMAVNLHAATMAGSAGVWFSAWTELAAREPALALAMVLLSPPFLWPAPAPATVALSAPDALAACSDERAWSVLAEAIAGSERAPGGGEMSFAACHLPARAELVEAILTVAEPMVAACEAGAFAHALVADEALILAAPSIYTDGSRLHRADGPARAWPRTRAGAWKGFLLPEGFVAPDGIAADAILGVTGRLQHVLLDIYAHKRGFRRCMEDIGAIVVHEDCTGRLWSVSPPRHALAPQPDSLRMLEVIDSAIGQSGARRTYWLGVPPEMRTAREAVAWAHGMTPEQHDGLALRT